MNSRDQRAFLKFHRANPEVFHKLRDMALDLKAKGFKCWGVWNLYGHLRYTHALETGTDGYKLANGHIAYYARLLMQEVPELNGFFEIRGDVQLPEELLPATGSLAA